MMRISRLKRFISLPLFVCGLWGMSIAQADPGCQNAKVIGPKLITDICWSCLFPIRIAGVPISGAGGRIPEEAVKSPLCTCRDGAGLPRPGVTTSMWEPAQLVEFQRVPGCSSVLNGTHFPGASRHRQPGRRRRLLYALSLLCLSAAHLAGTVRSAQLQSRRLHGFGCPVLLGTRSDLEQRRAGLFHES